MKYVVLEHPTKMPVIVCGMMTSHDTLAASYQAAGYRATSAGFLRVVGGTFETFGFSPSLQLTPNAGDARLIAAMHKATLNTAPVIPSSLDPLNAEPAKIAEPAPLSAPSALSAFQNSVPPLSPQNHAV